MAKAPDEVPQDKLDLYRRLIDTHPEIELKGGMKLPYTSVNGHMFSSLTKDGRVGIRLSAEDRETFLEEHDAVPFTNYGANIREHVEIPEAMLQKPAQMAPWLARSYTYTLSLKPK